MFKKLKDDMIVKLTLINNCITLNKRITQILCSKFRGTQWYNIIAIISLYYKL